MLRYIGSYNIPGFLESQQKCYVCNGQRSGELEYVFSFDNNQRKVYYHRACMEDILLAHIIEEEHRDTVSNLEDFLITGQRNAVKILVELVHNNFSARLALAQATGRDLRTLLDPNVQLLRVLDYVNS